MVRQNKIKSNKMFARLFLLSIVILPLLPQLPRLPLLSELPLLPMPPLRPSLLQLNPIKQSNCQFKGQVRKLKSYGSFTLAIFEARKRTKNACDSNTGSTLPPSVM
jgi:hypothetical protein